METRISQKVEFTNIGETVREIERKFQVDPNYRDWKNKKEINIRCPECSVKRFHAHYHLGLSFTKNAYNCYRCPFHGRLSDFLKNNRIKFETRDRVHYSDPTSLTSPKIKIPIDFSRDENIAREAKQYMADRGFDLKFVKKNFKIWPITNKNHFYFGYIIMELNDYAFYARRFSSKAIINQKHIIRKSDPEMKLFYRYDKNNSNTILVVESMLNLVKAAQFGYDSVCIFGKGHWAGFVEYLKNHNEKKNLCLCFDKDVSTGELEKFVKKIFRSHKQIKLSWIDSEDMWYNDIADIKTKEELIKMINKKKSIDEIFLKLMSTGAD